MGRGGRPAGPAGLGLRARGSTAGTEGLSLRARCPWVLPACPADSASRRGPRGSKSLPSGTERPSAGRVGRPSGRRYSASGCGRRGRPAGPAVLGLRARGSTAGTAGLSLRAWGTTSLPCGLSLRALGYTSLPSRTSLLAQAAGVNQPAQRDSASLPGVRGFYQPSQRDSASRRGPRGSTSRLGGTRPPGAGQHSWISRAGGTQPPCTVSVGSTSQPDGLSLRARCSTRLPGGLSLLARDAGVDHPALWYSASVCGPRGRPACPAGLSLLAQAEGSTSRHGGTRPPYTVSVGSTSLPGRLSLRVRSTEVDLPSRGDSASRRGPRGSTSWPGGTEHPGAGL